VCKHMNGELASPAKLRTENCPGCEKQRTEKCPKGELSVFPNLQMSHGYQLVPFIVRRSKRDNYNMYFQILHSLGMNAITFTQGFNNMDKGYHYNVIFIKTRQ